MVKKDTGYDFDLLKFVKTCFMEYFGERVMCTFEEDVFC